MEYINIWYLIIDLIITIFCYMAIPTFIKNDEKKYTAKEATKISLLNSICVCIFFIILREILGIKQPYTIGGAAILYYYINKKYLLKDTSSKKPEQKTENKIVPAEKNKKTKKVEKAEKKKEINYNAILITLTSLLVAVLLFIGIYSLVDYINSLKRQITSYETSYNSLKTMYRSLSREYSEKKTEYLLKDIKINFFDTYIVFVLDGYGNYYYTYDQMEQVTNGNSVPFSAYNISSAIANGYKAFAEQESSWEKYLKERNNN